MEVPQIQYIDKIVDAPVAVTQPSVPAESETSSQEEKIDEKPPGLEEVKSEPKMQEEEKPSQVEREQQAQEEYGGTSCGGLRTLVCTKTGPHNEGRSQSAGGAEGRD